MPRPARRGRKFPPLKADHPMVTEPDSCYVCGQDFHVGQEVTILIGPPGNAEEHEKMLAGGAYNAIGYPIHWVCPEAG